jgi:hypothetical protein
LSGTDAYWSGNLLLGVHAEREEHTQNYYDVFHCLLRCAFRRVFDGVYLVRASTIPLLNRLRKLFVKERL